MKIILIMMVAFCPQLVESVQLPAVLQEGSILQGHDNELCSAAARSDREFDLVIYGATGFTGELAAKYLAAGLPGDPTWAVAGRSQAELSNLSSALAGGASRPGPQIVVADLQDFGALQAMTKRTKVILTFAGPYELYGGENLIKAALSTCTDYADITGETAWKAEMLEKYGTEARARGIAIVQSVGLDSLPADLVAMLAAEEVAADDQGPPTEVAVQYTKANGARSGGSQASAIHQLTHHLPAGPYALAPGAKQASSLPATTLFEQHDLYFMSICDLPVMHRSMSLRFPEAAISISEDSSPSVAEEADLFKSDPRMLTDPPPANPSPGEGPPDWILEEGSFALEGKARRSTDGRTAGIRLEGSGDPGYLATPKMAVEFALGLAREGAKAGGFLTPSLTFSPGRLREILELADGGKVMNFTDV